MSSDPSKSPLSIAHPSGKGNPIVSHGTGPEPLPATAGRQGQRRQGDFPRVEESKGAVVLKGNAADAGRNLALGVVCALALIPSAGIAFWSAPKESFVALSTALVLGLLFFLGMQFRLFVQRNGVFFMLMAGLLLAVLVPILVRVVTTGSEWAQTFAEFKRQQTTTFSRTQANSSPQGQPSASVAMPLAIASQAKADSSLSAPPNADLPAQSQPANAGGDPEYSRVKGASLGEGSLLKQKAAQGGPSGSQLADPDEDPVQRATRQAKDEAIRRYPALQSPGTGEHKMYLEAYNELARSRKFEFFKDPQWPLKLAEIVALREGWKSSDATALQRVQPSIIPRTVLPGHEFSLDNLATAQTGVTQQGEVVKGMSSPEEASLSTAGAAAVGASPELSAEDEAVNRAMTEARRRYPAVAREGSPENRLFVEAYQELDSRRTDFFDRPDWPIRLVELVAKQEGWKRAGVEASVEKASLGRSPNTKEMPLPQ